jgi:transcription antitermination factor NusG
MVWSVTHGEEGSSASDCAEPAELRQSLGSGPAMQTSARARTLSAMTNPAQQGGGARWYAVLTHAHSEELAARHLANQDFQTYLPMRLRTVRHARRFVTKRSAYFNRYLFVSLDVQRQRWRATNATVGVIGLVMCGAMPLPVPRGIVEALISATDEEGMLRPSELLPGQKVRVTAGAFLDQLGVLDRLDSNGAVRILLEIMSRQVPVQLGRDQIVVLS